MKGDYGKFEYEVGTTFRVYADDSDQAYKRGKRAIKGGLSEYHVRLIDDEGEDMQDTTMPTGKWEFDQEVTDAFDDMLERSIPQYEVMRRAVHDIAAGFLVRLGGSGVLDLGCSRGEAIAKLAEEFERVQFTGVDISEPMVKAASRRFKGYDNVAIIQRDIGGRVGRVVLTPDYNLGVVMAVLTLQFVHPVEMRADIVRRCYTAMDKGAV